MATEVQQTSYKTLNRLTGYPLVSDTYQQFSTYYTWAKEQNTYVNSTLNLAETGVKKMALTAQPLVDRFDGRISSLDNIVSTQLEKLETTYPVVKKPTAEIVQDTQKYYTDNLKPVVDRAIWPVTTAVHFGHDQATRLVNSSAVLKRLETHLTTLSEEWKKEVEAAKMGEGESQSDTSGLLAATRRLAENTRLSLMAAGHVLYGHVSEENKARLTKARTYTDDLISSLSKAKKISDLSSTFFTHATHTLQYARECLEKAVQFVTKFVPFIKAKTVTPGQTNKGDVEMNNFADGGSNGSTDGSLDGPQHSENQSPQDGPHDSENQSPMPEQPEHSEN